VDELECWGRGLEGGCSIIGAGRIGGGSVCCDGPDIIVKKLLFTRYSVRRREGHYLVVEVLLCV
jgi:hypothetical protein